MSQARRGPQQHHLNMRVKPEPGCSQPSSPATQNGHKATNGHQANGIEGKRRKLVAQKTPNGGPENTNVLHQQWNASTSDGRIAFKILSQPEIQHRARYQTEGSRGAIKDRAGTGFPTLRLEGYSRPAKIQIFIGNDAGKVVPHMFYQVCRVTGKNSNPCNEIKMDGTDVIELSFEPQLGNMTIVCDCVGILKERFADVEARFPKLKTWKNVKKKSTKCRLVFRTVVENYRGEPETLQVVSEVINCTQLPGTPEILKMSTAGCSVEGGEELWIIGKNFLKDTKVIFSHSVAGKTEPLWSKFTDPDQDLFHQTHLITKIPPFYDSDIQEDMEVTVYIKCGDKLSDPAPFTYRPKAIQFTYSHSASLLAPDSALPRGVAAPAVAIAQQYAQTGSVSVISAMEKVEVDPGQPRPTILEPLHHHKNKKSRLDFAGRNARRTRSVPRPNLINEDTVFVSEGTGVKVIYTSFAQNPMSPWKGRSPAPELVPSVIQNPPQPIQPILPDPLQPPTKRSFSFTDESSNSCFSYAENTRDTMTDTMTDTMVDESSQKQNQTNSDFSSTLTTDFSNVFRIKPLLACDQPGASSYTATPPLITTLTATPPTTNSYPAPPSATYSTTSPTSSTYPSTPSVANSYPSTPSIASSYPTTPSVASPYPSTPSVASSYSSTPSVASSYPVTPPTGLSYPVSPPTTKVEVEPSDQGCVILTPENTKDGLTRPSSANDAITEENKDLPNVSVKATSEEKATISISLPTSILRDQKHFQNVIETINNTLLRSSFNEPEESEPEAPEAAIPPTPPVPSSISPQRASVTSPTTVGTGWTQDLSPTQWTKSPPPGLTTSPLPTSHPVSVLSCRKRNFSSEPVADQPPEFYSSTAGATQFKETVEEFKLAPASITGCTSVISETPAHQIPPLVPVEAPTTFQDTFKPMEVTPPPDETPYLVYQETPQEKKWTAEFNEVMQTVIEDHKEGKAMEWSAPATEEPAVAVVAPPATTTTDWDTQATLVPDPVAATKSQEMEWSLVKEATPVEATSQYIAVDAAQTFPEQPKPTVQFLEPPAEPAVYDQFGTQILTNPFPVAALPTLETVVEQEPMATFTGDPMLSETSAVIGVQKEIESAYRTGEEEAAQMGAEQQWGHEWTYGSSS